MFSVYGTKKTTGEFKLVFRCIDKLEWLRKGKQNAESHGYTGFKFYQIPELANGFCTKEITV